MEIRDRVKQLREGVCRLCYFLATSMSHHFDESSEKSILIIDIFSFNLDLQNYSCLGLLPTFWGTTPIPSPLGPILVSRSKVGHQNTLPKVR